MKHPRTKVAYYIALIKFIFNAILVFKKMYMVYAILTI